MKSITIDAEKCKSCELCIEVCPKKLIILDENKINQNGYRPATLKDFDACTACAQCYVICAHVAIKIERD
jgi:2-oxoglutarate ferredoxin oxidoreductase subunit delta